jgi:hypothetical protein
MSLEVLEVETDNSNSQLHELNLSRLCPVHEFVEGAGCEGWDLIVAVVTS